MNSAAVALLRSPPFATFPLRVRCFTSETYEIITHLARLVEEGIPGPAALLKDKPTVTLISYLLTLSPMKDQVLVELDLKGLSNSFSPVAPEPEEKSEHYSPPPLDLSDERFRLGDAGWGRWSMLSAEIGTLTPCHFCREDVDTSVSGSWRPRFLLFCFRLLGLAGCSLRDDSPPRAEYYRNLKVA